MQLLRAAERPVVPWKNHGGTTAEIMAWPPDCDYETFAWRLSLASVTENGPFSTFAQTDRLLQVLQGRLRLKVEGEPPVDLQAGGRAHRFSGDVATLAYVLEGPVLNLNLMSRRRLARARLQGLDAGADSLAAADGPRVLLATGAARLTGGSGAVSLAPLDAVLIEASDGPLRLKAAARVYLASFEAA